MKIIDEETLRKAGFEDRGFVDLPEHGLCREMVWRGFVANHAALRVQVVLVDGSWRLGKVAASGPDIDAILQSRVPNGTLDEYVQYCLWCDENLDVGRI